LKRDWNAGSEGAEQNHRCQKSRAKNSQMEEMSVL
jgi:hypothetical protein